MADACTPVEEALREAREILTRNDPCFESRALTCLMSLERFVGAQSQCRRFQIHLTHLFNFEQWRSLLAKYQLAQWNTLL